MPVVRPPPPHGTSTVSMLVEILDELEPDRPVAGHDGVVQDGVDEQALDARVRALLHRLPPAVERHLDHGAAEPLDRVELRLRRVVGRDDRRRHAVLARHPGDALRHVAGARRHDAVARARRRRADRIAFAAPRILNEPIGCRHSSLSQISRGRLRQSAGGRAASGSPTSAIRSRAASISASGIRTRPRRRRRARAPGHAELGGGEILDRDPHRLEHRQLVVGACGPRPCRRAARPARRRCDPARCPRSAEREEEVARLVQRRLAPVDEERAPRRPCRASSSRDFPSGTPPAALMCVPGASQSSSTIGSRADVAVQTTSAPSTRLLDRWPRRASGSRARAPRHATGCGSRSG